MRRDFGLLALSVTFLAAGLAHATGWLQSRDDQRQRKEAERVTQATLARFAEIKDQFGISRVLPATYPHYVAPRANVGGNDAPDDLLISVYVDGVKKEKYTRDNGTLKFVGFMNRSVPKEFQRSISFAHPVSSNEQDRWTKQDQAFRTKIKALLVTGGETVMDRQFVYVRPIKAQQACIRCHTTSKPGDALGTVVVAVRDLAPPKS